MNYYKDCINCIERGVGCSGCCGKYMSAKQAHEAEKKKARLEKETYSAVVEMVINTVDRNRRRKNLSTYSYRD